MVAVVITVACISAIFLALGSGLGALQLARWAGLRLRYQVLWGLVGAGVGTLGTIAFAWLCDAPAVVPLCSVGAMLAAAGLRRLSRHWRSKWWAETAAALELSADGPRMSGTLEGAWVDAQDLRFLRTNALSDLVVGRIHVNHPDWTGHLTARAGSFNRRQLTAGAGTGDPHFDRRVRADGETRHLLAHLDPRARALVMEAVTVPEMVLNRDGLSYTRGAWFTRRDEVLKAIRVAVQVMNTLTSNENSIPERLLMNLRREPLPEVRRRLLQCLLEEPEPYRQRALELALEDEDARVQGLAMLTLADAAPEAFQGRLALAAPDGGDLSLSDTAGQVALWSERRAP